MGKGGQNQADDAPSRSSIPINTASGSPTSTSTSSSNLTQSFSQFVREEVDRQVGTWKETKADNNNTENDDSKLGQLGCHPSLTQLDEAILDLESRVYGILEKYGYGGTSRGTTELMENTSYREVRDDVVRMGERTLAQLALAMDSDDSKKEWRLQTVDFKNRLKRLNVDTGKQVQDEGPSVLTPATVDTVDTVDSPVSFGDQGFENEDINDCKRALFQAEHESEKTHQDFGLEAENYVSSSSESLLGIVHRYLLPLFATLVFTFYALAYVSRVYFYGQILHPLVDAVTWDEDRAWNEITYIERDCTLRDITTRDHDDLTVGRNLEPKESRSPSSWNASTPGLLDDAMDIVLEHGLALIPQVLTPETTKAVRRAILKENSRQSIDEQFPVFESDHRWAILLHANQDPAIRQALHEIASHPVVRPMLEKLLGANPALFETNAITAEYGAVSQHYHYDSWTEGSHLLYGRSFMPVYELFIPLQPTTADMGATGICPGSHMCAEYDEACTDVDFRALAKNGGDAMLMNSQLVHAGMAHTHPRAPKRVVLIMSFTSRPNLSARDAAQDGRALPLGVTHSTRWNMWGRTLNDCLLLGEQLWTPFKSIGLSSSSGASAVDVVLSPLGITGSNNAAGDAEKTASTQQVGWNVWLVEALYYANADVNQRVPFPLEQWFQDYIEWIYETGFGRRMFGHAPQHLEYENDEEEDYGSVYSHGAVLERAASWLWTRVLWVIFLGTVPALLSILLSALKITSSSFHHQLRLKSLANRMFRQHVSVSVLVAGLLLFLNHVTYPWTSGVRMGRLFQASRFGQSPLPSLGEDYSEFVVERPGANDILVGDRLHSRRLFANRRYLDYHPGNKQFRKVAKSPMSSAYLSKSTSAPLRSAILSALIYEAQYIHRSQFLVQNTYGEFVEMTPHQIREFSRKTVLMENSKLLWHLLDELDMVLGQAKYSRGAVVNRRWGVLSVLGLRQKLYDLVDPDDASKHALEYRVMEKKRVRVDYRTDGGEGYRGEQREAKMLGFLPRFWAGMP